jgi:hypothetical protein
VWGEVATSLSDQHHQVETNVIGIGRTFAQPALLSDEQRTQVHVSHAGGVGVGDSMAMFPRSRRKQGKIMRWMGRSTVGGTAIDNVFVTTQWLKNNGSAYGLIRPASQQVQIPQASIAQPHSSTSPWTHVQPAVPCSGGTLRRTPKYVIYFAQTIIKKGSRTQEANE